MNSLIIDRQDKAAIEQLVDGLLSVLYQQKHCGINTVSTDIEIGSLEEVLHRVHQLGSKGICIDD